jgi:predicted GNAT family acetyltransferase
VAQQRSRATKFLLSGRRGGRRPTAGALGRTIGWVNEPYRVVDNPEELRYEIHVRGELAGYIRYRIEPGIVVLVHTDVEPKWEGGWVGKTLVREALDDLRSRGLNTAVICPYIRSFVHTHPDYLDLVVADPAVGD